jgi:hypothetical protein
MRLKQPRVIVREGKSWGKEKAWKNKKIALKGCI